MVVVCLTRDVVLLLPPQTTCQDIKTQTQTSGEQTMIKYTMWSHTLAYTPTCPCDTTMHNMKEELTLPVQTAHPVSPLLFPGPAESCDTAARRLGSPLPCPPSVGWLSPLPNLNCNTNTNTCAQNGIVNLHTRLMEKNNVISSWIWSRHWVLHNVALIIQLKMIVRSKEGRMFQALLKWVTLLCYNFEYMFLEKELQTNNPIRIMMYMW